MIKTVGRRRVEPSAPGALQHTLASVRGTGAVVPRGVYRFKSFDEATTVGPADAPSLGVKKARTAEELSRMQRVLSA
jgi:hypothetical protein